MFIIVADEEGACPTMNLQKYMPIILMLAAVVMGTIGMMAWMMR